MLTSNIVTDCCHVYLQQTYRGLRNSNTVSIEARECRSCENTLMRINVRIEADGITGITRTSESMG